jgi:hypothetical protein
MDRVVFRLAAPTRDLGELKAALHLPGFHLLIDKHRTYEVLRASWFQGDRAFEVRSYPYEGMIEFTVSAPTPDGIRELYLRSGARAAAAARACSSSSLSHVYAAGISAEVDEVFLAPTMREYRLRISARPCPTSEFVPLLAFWRNMFPEVVPSAGTRNTLVDRGVYIMQAFEMFRPPSYEPIRVRFAIDPSPVLELCVPLSQEVAGRELASALAACGKFRQEARVVCSPGHPCFVTTTGETYDLAASLRNFALPGPTEPAPIEPVAPEDLEVVAPPPASSTPPVSDTGLPELTVDDIMSSLIG